MIKIIHITGASGSGTSTLGKAIEENFNFTHIDVDDYFWLPTDPPFIKKRAIDERIKLLREDISKSERCVITGSLCGWGDMLIPLFNLIIRIETPAEIRLERIHKREHNRFGERILQGGDMYEEHIKFIEWARSYDTAGLNSRSKALHDIWLSEIQCKKVVVNGTKPLEEIIKMLEEVILKDEKITCEKDDTCD